MEIERFYNNHRPHQGIANTDHHDHCQCDVLLTPEQDVKMLAFFPVVDQSHSHIGLEPLGPSHWRAGSRAFE